MSQENMTLPQQVVEYVGLTSAALEKASAVADQQEKTAAAIREKAPKVAQTLADHGRIRPDEVEKAAAKLQDPSTALDVLAKVAAHRNHEEQQATKSAGSLGQPVGHNKQASDSESPYVGRIGGGPRESDRRLFKGVGLQYPE